MDSKPKSRGRNYKHKNIKLKQYRLGTGEKGFLCSCNNREKECIRECYVILNKYADEVCNPSVIETESTRANTLNDDLEDALKKEIASLNASHKNASSRRFQVVESGAKNFLFIRTNLDDPVLLATNIIRDIHEAQQLQTRHLIRLIPIEATCKAYISNIKSACSQLLEKHFKECARTFSVIYNHRNNDSLSRDEIIKEIADLVFQTRNDHVVNLNNADVSVIIEVVRGIALLAVIPNYLKYRKFNLQAIHDLNKTEQVGQLPVSENNDETVHDLEKDAQVHVPENKDEVVSDDKTTCTK